MTAPVVSIITRTRDRPLLLQRAAASVLGQVNAPTWEWIIVNDAGDPAPVDALRQDIREKHGPEKAPQVIHLERSKGMEHASNSGLKAAKGPFITIHDDDDSWHPTFLNRMHGWLSPPKHAAYAGVVCQSVRVVEERKENTIEQLDEHLFNPELTSLTFWDVLKENRFPPISFCFRSRILEEVGMFNEALPVLGDWEFNLRVLARRPLAVIPEPLAYYHHRQEADDSHYANSISAEKTHRQTERLLRQQWGRHNPFGLPVDVVAHAAQVTAHIHQIDTGLTRIQARLNAFPVPPEAQY